MNIFEFHGQNEYTSRLFRLNLNNALILLGSNSLLSQGDHLDLIDNKLHIPLHISIFLVSFS
ncbi:hypothetical protein CY0110_19567 [Crocosphaera chwakensis CCY0110]|uniref:Uncharacterized protein n=1 Tax=Crocosphaera chwakensis CCY0110 TaxID=391612 RepID=A3IJP5_9CHRO|nr:hypothetical protein CY0110_19567 [Crocosphaera chwakensis CCY0110]